MYVWTTHLYLQSSKFGWWLGLDGSLNLALHVTPATVINLAELQQSNNQDVNLQELAKL